MKRKIFKYEVKEDTVRAKKGEFVYPFYGHDYGLTREDAMYTGIPHTCVTRMQDGGVPFFTIPTEALEEIVIYAE